MNILLMLSIAWIFLNQVSSDVYINDIEVLPMNENVYKAWSTLTLLEKIPYLLDQIQVNELRKEYNKLKSDNVENDNVNLSNFRNKIIEFVNDEDIEKFFANCDVNDNNEVSFTEYVICRGDYDEHGLWSEASEYDEIENEILDDYRQKRIKMGYIDE